MGEIVNLRRAREAKAAESRAQYGRSKSERATSGAEARRLEATLDGSRLDVPQPRQ